MPSARSRPPRLRGRGAIATAALTVTALLGSWPNLATTETDSPPASATAVPVAMKVTVPPNVSDPSTWSDTQLAAQLVLAGTGMGDLRRRCADASRGLGGFVLFGSPTSRLRADLARVQSCRPRIGADGLTRPHPWFASDEEGGRVQRLSRLLGTLPSAASMGRSMSDARIEATARRYAQRMRALGVHLTLGPVADLAYRGSYIARDGRSFAASPGRASRHVAAWVRGLTAGGTGATVKHWPGHGSARDTHTGAGRTLAWTALQARDLKPFRAAVATGATAVMVGHLIVPGLTGRLPASQSPAALAQLRREAGPDALIVTDSLAMDAVTTALRQSQATAAVRALAAGADVVLLNETNPWSAVRAIVQAMRTGRLDREHLVESARRVLAAKARLGLAGP